MKIAVTGATGGLGRSLVEYLLEKNVQVAALGRNKNVGTQLSALGAEFYSGEITDVEYLKTAFRGADLVVHCAGLASPWGVWESFEQANVQGTAAVLRAMRELQITKLVHISTPSVYFNGQPRENIRESDPLPETENFYARSKRMADKLVLAAVRNQNLKAVLLRPRAIFGKYDGTILPRMLKIMRKGYFPLIDGGQARVDLTAVENVVHAIGLAIEKIDRFSGDVFNISNGEPMPVEELVRWLDAELKMNVRFIRVPSAPLKALADLLEIYAKKVSGREPVISRYSIESMGTTQTLSIEKARQVLGYEPVISVRDAMRGVLKEQSI